jgi:serine/threonine-protein kinase RsbW
MEKEINLLLSTERFFQRSRPMTSKSNQLTVSGYFKNLTQIGDFINRAAIQAGLDNRAAFAIHMAVDEACANIIEHAYGGEGRGQIRVTYKLHEDGLEVIIYDQGKQFDPSQLPELDTQATLSERYSRGMGVFFIRNLMDRVEYKFGTPQGNQLILFKRRESTV